ncbi:UDP-GlcNAc:undecaprenyl-phosphate GlcNAc-1-phosphate transferase [Scopulibacillus daqui]|uniref:UDP-GlcNAc:undecaprenyl-phosphate GlcNAc-1-phosphate transferase n=1 Tax=Scopulibacillus daqui TaxID=1469162 RepID=A0ABS2Q032_9BACL|nr:UDP-GlcNAc:undecaprenyl-phosphate GlcNAc-1-phosphate transferase [Scopulibacillus daqui]
MHFFNHYTFAFFISLIVTIMATPIVKRVAIRFNFVDNPNDRKIHKQAMPYLGGIAIAIGFFAGYIFLKPISPVLPAFILGAILILITGAIDDKWSISPKYKLLAQLIVAIIVVSSGVSIDFITFPILGHIDFGWWSYPITIFWIVGMMNAINLIDGLDGLACGVSAIALSSMLVMAIINAQLLAISLSVILLGSMLGFLFFNSHPASIFMGDTGSLFIGYTLSIISIIGLFKSITIFSLILPIIILAVPILDTSLAIIRRLLSGQKISSPDRSHLHHRLIDFGFSHRTTVYIIYTISFLFGLAAIIFTKSIIWGSLLILGLCIVMLQFTIEIINVLKTDRKKPLLNFVKKFVLAHQTSSRGK